MKESEENEQLSDYRLWWLPGVASFVAISLIVYVWFDSLSFYKGWSFWWRVIMDACLFGGGFLLYAYSDEGKKTEVSAGEYLENVKARIITFWAVCLLALVVFSLMPGKLVRSNISFPDAEPGEWSRP